MIDPKFLEMERREIASVGLPKSLKVEHSGVSRMLILSDRGLKLRAKLFYEDDLREAKKARDERINKNIVNGEFSTIWELDDDEELKENKMWRKASDSIRRL